MAEGRTGILTPEGRFLKCEWGGHWHLARKVLKKFNILKALGKSVDDTLRDELYIFMGVTYHTAYILFPPYGTNFTDKQTKWFKKNWATLDERQQKELNEYGPMNGWEPLS